MVNFEFLNRTYIGGAPEACTLLVVNFQFSTDKGLRSKVFEGAKQVALGAIFQAGLF